MRRCSERGKRKERRETLEEVRLLVPDGEAGMGCAGRYTVLAGEGEGEPDRLFDRDDGGVSSWCAEQVR